MSSINLGDTQVLKNFVKNQIKELKGKIVEKEKVLVFVDTAGNEFVVPDDIREEVEIKIEKKKQEAKPKVEIKKEVLKK